jgi:drug/metabolite transporter (DMT)-like permease
VFVADVISLTPAQALGIPVALIGSVFLAIGAQLQHRGVGQVEQAKSEDGTHGHSSSGLSLSQLLALARRPPWVIGTLMLGLAIVLQLTSLYLAPLTVVQPLGAVALVITAIVNARVTKSRLDRASVRAIVFCVVGVGLFVTIAALTTASRPILDAQLTIVLIVLGSVLAILIVFFIFGRRRFTATSYNVAAGVLFGFVATLAKVVIDRVHTLFEFGFHLMPADWLTIVCVLALIVAALSGSYFVQTAYASGPPDLVVAGLTVIDPMVGVTIGIVVLGEAAGAPLWAVFAFVIAGAIAIFGVFQLARHHPQIER